VSDPREKSDKAMKRARGRSEKASLKAAVVHRMLGDKTRGISSLQSEEKLTGITALRLGRERKLSALAGKLFRDHISCHSPLLLKVLSAGSGTEDY